MNYKYISAIISKFYVWFFCIISLFANNFLLAQTKMNIEEPIQSWVFHVEKADGVSFYNIAQTISQAFPALDRVLPCEKGHYIVLIPREAFPPDEYESFRQAVADTLAQHGWHPYFKEGASVVELSQNCEELIKPLLKP